MKRRINKVLYLKMTFILSKGNTKLLNIFKLPTIFLIFNKLLYTKQFVRGIKPNSFLPTAASLKGILTHLKKRNFIKDTTPRKQVWFLHLKINEIITYYKIIENSLLNYFCFAYNYKALLQRIHFIMKSSCALTIAFKLKFKTLRGLFNRLHKNL